MSKYWQVFGISLKQEFAYRINFIMWRVRNIMQMLLIFFLWDSVFQNPGRELFGYSRAQIMTYVFGIFVLRAIVTSSRAQDVAGEIAQGNLTNYLLKPVNYLSYWFTRDISSKILNIFFVVFEIGILYWLLRPQIFYPQSIFVLLLFVITLALSVVLYFFLLIFFGSFTFWIPEQAWGMIFILNIFVDLLGGLTFPLDILPTYIQHVLYLTPFPYLVFVPLQIFLGKYNLSLAFQSVGVSAVWVLIMYGVLRTQWRFGLRAYRAEGR